jgi:nucleoside-diphosphate-sugar epimerase
MSLFITGSTGFLGTCLLYLLDENKYQYPIYLLIRKKKLPALDRFKEIQNNFPLLKLHIVENDILEISKLVLHVDYIINCAASIDFNLELQEAIIQNVDGLLALIEFAKKNSIKNFIHISTAYVSPHGEYAKEKFIKMKNLGNISKLYSNIKSDKITFNDVIKKIYFPNTYCFTKCLAEKFIEKELINNNNNTFFQIIRPSIITNSVKIPYPGWFKGYGATIGVHKLITSKLLNVLICNKNTKLDYIPVDYVAKKIYKSLTISDEIKEHTKKNKKYCLIKHSTSFFTPTIEEMKLFLNKNNFNTHIFEKKNLIYYFYRYYNLIKIVIMVILNYLLGYTLSSIYKENIYIANKLIKILFLVNSIQPKFNHFLHNTYYFKSKINNTIDKNYEYYTTMINAIKKQN